MLLNQPTATTTTRFTLLHSSHKPSELPPPEILGPLIAYSQAHPERLRLSLFVGSREGPPHPTVPSSAVTVGRIGLDAVERATGSLDQSWWRRLFGGAGENRLPERGNSKRVMFLVCGPDSYVRHASASWLMGLTTRPHFIRNDRMIADVAGPFGRNFSQGEIGGVLGKLGYGRDSVWKL